MRKKIFYLLMLISCISIITSAKQRNCQVNTQCSLRISEKATQVIKASRANDKGFDLSPLHHFVFNS